MKPLPYGFRIVGDCSARRRLINWAAAWAGHAACDERAEVTTEAYLSAFTFGDDFRDQLRATGSTRGFSGPCWAPFIWFDIDRADELPAALEAARRLSAVLTNQLGASEESVLVFFSGSKGFHLGLPCDGWSPEPGPNFHRVARRFAELVAEWAGVNIDRAVYDQVRAFRAPNSRHPKTGLYKRRLSLDELSGLSMPGIVRLAERSEPFEPGRPSNRLDRAAELWQQAIDDLERRDQKAAERRGRGQGPQIHLATRRFLTDGAEPGERHNALFAAARNLADFNCPPTLAHALLDEPARDSGLAPSEARRIIENALRFVAAGGSR